MISKAELLDDKHPITCATAGNANDPLAPWHRGQPVPSHPSWLGFPWCNQPGSGLRNLGRVRSCLAPSSSPGLLTILQPPLPHAAPLGSMAEITELLPGWADRPMPRSRRRCAPQDEAFCCSPALVDELLPPALLLTST